MGTSQSHDLEHCKCTDHFLGWEIAGKLAGKILDVLEMYQVGSGLVHCPCPCDGLAVFQPSTLDFAPSERMSAEVFGGSTTMDQVTVLCARKFESTKSDIQKTHLEC